MDSEPRLSMHRTRETSLEGGLPATGARCAWGLTALESSLCGGDTAQLAGWGGPEPAESSRCREPGVGRKDPLAAFPRGFPG